ncbi:DUF1793-domain-containing protein [Ramaria rubella]|nr:DUF1793-domain-containing protein [Ramaria rubella]
MPSFRFLLLVAQTIGYVLAQAIGVVGPPWTASPFHPHAIPLAVRSPFLNCWARGGNGSESISNQWPSLWDMTSTLGWAMFVRVDGIAYRVLGDAPLASGALVANQTGFSFSATQSKFTHTAGNVMVTTTFISPIEPTNLVLQSLPAAYLSVSTQSMDGSPHSIQVYSDISGEWISGEDSLTEAWSTNTSSPSYVIHSVHLQTPQSFTVVQNHIQDATAYYGTSSSGVVTWQTAQDVVARGHFMSSGQLTNTSDNNFRAVSTDFPVFAISTDLGTVTVSTGPVVFALGLIRDPAILGLSPAGQPEERSLYFWSQFASAFDAMNYFISDFSRAASAANSFDSSVRNSAVTVSSDYADLIDLSTRQVFGMIEITIGKDASGNYNESDVQAFMNAAGGGFVLSTTRNEFIEIYDIHFHRVSTVDIMFPAFPVFLQTNPVIAGALLKPLLQWQQGNGYPHPWAAHDLGTQYPKAEGDTKDDVMPIEETANMLIMTLAQVRRIYYGLLDRWTSESFTDSGLTGAVVNDTNLALKGILGIQAMAGIANAMNNSDATTKYSGIASTLLDEWRSRAFTTDGSHLVLNFGNSSSSLGLPYNLYADRLLGFNMVPQAVYDSAALWVAAQNQTYGVAMDSRSSVASKTDWTLFTAAALNDTNTRNTLISSVRNYAANQLAHVPFSDYYDASQGTSINFQARPVQGAMYSILALQVPSKSIILPPQTMSATLPPPHPKGV